MRPALCLYSSIYISIYCLLFLPASSSCSFISILNPSIGSRVIRMWPEHTSICSLHSVPTVVLSMTLVYAPLNGLCGTFTRACLMDRDDSHLSSTDSRVMFKITIRSSGKFPAEKAKDNRTKVIGLRKR